MSSYNPSTGLLDVEETAFQQLETDDLYVQNSIVYRGVNLDPYLGQLVDDLSGNLDNLIDEVNDLSANVVRTDEIQEQIIQSTLNMPKLRIANGGNTSDSNSAYFTYDGTYAYMFVNGGNVLSFRDNGVNFTASAGAYFSSNLVLSNDNNDVVISKTGADGKSLRLQAGDDGSTANHYIEFKARNGSSALYTAMRVDGVNERIDINKSLQINEDIEFNNTTAPTDTEKRLYMKITDRNDLMWEDKNITGEIDDISSNLYDLSNVVSSNITTIDDLSGVVYDLSGVVSSNITTINDLSGVVYDLSGVVYDLSNVVSSNITTINDLSGFVYDLSGVVDTNKSNIALNSSLISSNTSAIGQNTLSIISNGVLIGQNTTAINQNTSSINTIKGTGWTTETIKGNADNIASNTSSINNKVSKSGDTMTGDLVFNNCDLDFTDGTNTTKQELSSGYWRLKWNGNDLLQATNGAFNFIGATYYSAPLVLSGDGNDVALNKTGTSGKSLLLQAGDNNGTTDDYSIIMRTRNSSNIQYDIMEAKGKAEQIEMNRLVKANQGLYFPTYTPATTTNTLYYDGTDLLFDGSPVGIKLNGNVNTYETDGTTLNFTFGNNGIDISTNKATIALRKNDTATTTFSLNKACPTDITTATTWYYGIGGAIPADINATLIRFFFRFVDTDSLGGAGSGYLASVQWVIKLNGTTLGSGTNNYTTSYALFNIDLSVSQAISSGDNITIDVYVNTIGVSAIGFFKWSFLDYAVYGSKTRTPYGFYSDTNTTLIENDTSITNKMVGTLPLIINQSGFFLQNYWRTGADSNTLLQLKSPDGFTSLSINSYGLRNGVGWGITTNQSTGELLGSSTELKIDHPTQITLDITTNINGDLDMKRNGWTDSTGNSDSFNLGRWKIQQRIFPFVDFQMLYFSYYNGSSYIDKGYLDRRYDVGQIDFTGQHRQVITNPKTELKAGMILVSTGKIKNYATDLSNIDKPTINEALPILELSTKPKMKNVYGVYSGSQDINEHKMGIYVSILEPTDKTETYHYVNGSGEGSILVCNQMGDIENGDFIITSYWKGIGMKSDSENFNCYTIAKATMDYKFKSSDEVALISCLYML